MKSNFLFKLWNVSLGRVQGKGRKSERGGGGGTLRMSRKLSPTSPLGKKNNGGETHRRGEAFTVGGRKRKDDPIPKPSRKSYQKTKKTEREKGRAPGGQMRQHATTDWKNRM